MGVTESLLTHPDSDGLPNVVSLPPTSCYSRGAGGKGWGLLTLGRQGLIHTKEILYCGKCVHKGPYGSLLHRAFGQGGGRGRGSCQKAHFQRAVAPPPQTAGRWATGESRALFPRWLGSCDVLHRQSFTLQVLCTSFSHPVHCPPSQTRWANSGLNKVS